MIVQYFYSKRRLENFSDLVIAILSVAMVLQIPVSRIIESDDFTRLIKGIFVFFLNFFVIGSFWHRHHKAIDKLEYITSKIILCNHIFLFFLALLPIFTKLIMENLNESRPIILSNIVFILANLTFIVLLRQTYEQTPSDEQHGLKIINKNLVKYIWLNLLIQGFMFLGMIFSFIGKQRMSAIFLILFPLFITFLNMIIEERGLKEKIKK